MIRVLTAINEIQMQKKRNMKWKLDITVVYGSHVYIYIYLSYRHSYFYQGTIKGAHRGPFVSLV